MMTLSARLVAVSLVLVAASCDSAAPPPGPPPTSRAWTLGPCIDAPGVAALFVGGPDFTCVSEAGTFESALDTLGYTGGNLFLHGRDSDVLLVLKNLSLAAHAYSLDMQTGRVRQLSVGGTFSSQIFRLDANRFLITDYLGDRSVSAPDRFVFSVLDGEQTRTTLRIEIPDVGRVLFADGDYDPVSNTSAHLIVTTPDSIDRLLTVDHDTGTYRLEDLSYSQRPSRVRYRSDGALLVLDSYRGRVHTVADGRLVIDVGAVPDEVTARTLYRDDSGEVYTFTGDRSSARIIRLGAGGVNEDVAAVEGQQRFMHVSASAGAACLRTFRPYSEAGSATYDDVVTVYDLRTRTTVRRPVTLRTDYYDFPIGFACL